MASGLGGAGGTSEVDTEGRLREVESSRESHAQFGDRLPEELAQQLEQLEQRLRAG